MAMGATGGGPYQCNVVRRSVKFSKLPASEQEIIGWFISSFDQVLASFTSREVHNVNMWLQMVFYAVSVEELTTLHNHPFATLEKVITNATREAVEDSVDCDGIPSWMVHKVRSAITHNNYGGRQAWFKIREAFNINNEFLRILSRNLLQNIRCRSVVTLEDCLIKWDNRMRGGGNQFDS